MSSSAAEKSPAAAQKFRFGVYEADLQNRELRKRGVRVKLQQKPFQILEILLLSPGQLVRRTELAQRLWPGLHVNFDRSLNTAVNTLRKVLGDTSQNPHFIETRTGLGYRFIAPVEEVSVPSHVHLEPLAGSEAYRDCLQGRYFFNKLSEEDLHKSVAYYEAALARDPGCAPAYAGLADAFGMFAVLNMLPAGDAYARVKQNVASALTADPGLGEAHASLACMRRLFEWDWTGAEQEHSLALDLSPASATVHRQYGAYLAAAGRPEEALRELERARELDPVSLVIHVEIAWMLYTARDFSRAAEESWRALVMEPKFAPAQHTLGLAYGQMGMGEEAIVELVNARTCSGDHPAVVASLAYAYAAEGKTQEALETLSALHAIAERRYVSPYWYAVFYSGLRAAGAAFEWLDRAVRDRDVWLTWARVEPRLDPLREDARFSRLLAAIS